MPFSKERTKEGAWWGGLKKAQLGRQVADHQLLITNFCGISRIIKQLYSATFRAAPTKSKKMKKNIGAKDIPDVHAWIAWIAAAPVQLKTRGTPQTTNKMCNCQHS